MHESYNYHSYKKIQLTKFLRDFLGHKYTADLNAGMLTEGPF